MAERNYFLEGVQTGAGIAQNRIENSRRMQELKSAESLRRLQERQVAQNLQLQMEQNNLQIQYRADMEKAATAANLASSPIIPIATPMGATPFPNPQRMSQTDAAYRFMLPVIAKYEPDKVPGAMQNLAMAEYRQRASFEPEMSVMTDPVTGEQRTVMRTGRGSASLVPRDPMINAQRRFSLAEQAKMVDWVRDKAPKLMGRLVQDESGNLTVPQDLIPLVSEAADLSPSVKSEAQQQSIDTSSGLAELDKVMDTVNKTPEAFGLKGVKNAAIEIGKRQFVRGPTPITTARHTTAAAFQRLANSLRVDSGNMNKYELELLQGLGDFNAWQNAPDIAIGMAKNLEKSLIAQKIRVDKTLGKKPDASVLKRIPYQDFIGMTKSGLLSTEDAIEWYDANKKK